MSKASLVLAEAKSLFEYNRFKESIEIVQKYIQKNVEDYEISKLYEFLITAYRKVIDKENYSLAIKKILSIYKTNESYIQIENLFFQELVQKKCLHNDVKCQFILCLFEIGKIELATLTCVDLIAFYIEKKCSWKGLDLINKSSTYLGENFFWQERIQFMALIGDYTGTEKESTRLIKEFSKISKPSSFTLSKILNPLKKSSSVTDKIAGNLFLLMLLNDQIATKSSSVSEKEFLKIMFDCFLIDVEDTSLSVEIMKFCLLTKRKELGMIFYESKDINIQKLDIKKRSQARQSQGLYNLLKTIESTTSVYDVDENIDLAGDLFKTSKEKSKKVDKIDDTKEITRTRIQDFSSGDVSNRTNEVVILKELKKIIGDFELKSLDELIISMIHMRLYLVADYIVDYLIDRLNKHSNLEYIASLYYLKCEVALLEKNFSKARAAAEYFIANFPLKNNEKICFGYLHGMALLGLNEKEEAYKVFKFVEANDSDYRLVKRRLRTVEQI